MPILKFKNIKLTGKAKADFRAKVFERDHNQCVLCGGKAEDLHHTKRGCNRSDEEDCCVTLCHSCHMALHSDAKLSETYRVAVKNYLEQQRWRN